MNASLEHAGNGAAWLTSVESARRVLAEVETVDEAATLLEAAEVAKVYARNVMRSREAQNHAAHVSLLCQRKAGQLLAQQDGLGAQGGDRRSSDTVRLENLGVTKHDSSRWQKVAAIDEDEFTDHVNRITTAGEELTTAGLIRAAASRTNGQTVVGSEVNEWYTPADYIDAARTVMGGIDLDPATSEAANETVGADTIYTADDDGLSHDWAGRVWLNPPYGREAGEFVTKLVEHHDAGDVTAAVALVNAHCTDTRWFQRLWDHTLCFTDHRIDFTSPSSRASGSTHGSALVYLGRKPIAFAREFGRFGAVVRRYRP